MSVTPFGTDCAGQSRSTIVESSMPKLLIIADDLTGAMDSGVQLAKRGIATVVIPELHEVDEPWPCETLVVNTETRHSTPDKAAEAVTRAVRLGQKHGIKVFYKKTDSTLRGNIGSELEALLRGSMRKCLIFVPAFPRLGRTTREGWQYVEGVPLQNTDYANDPLNPIITGDVAEIVRLQTNVRTFVIPSNKLAAVSDFSEEGIYILNCENDNDLKMIGDSVRKLEMHCVFAGAGGFAEELALLFGNRPGVSPMKCLNLPERILVVNGSMSRAATRQTVYAERSGFAVLRLDPADLSYRNGWSAVSWDRVVSMLKEHPARQLILTSVCQEDNAPLLCCDQNAMLDFAENLGRLVASLRQQTAPRLLMVIGGDTLSGVTSALACNSIIPLAEILPGVVFSKLLCPDAEIFAISKAGGFGSDDAIVRVCEWARSMPQ